MLTVADIISSDGKYAPDNILTRRKELDRVTSFDWAIHGRPTVSSWTIWKKMIKHNMLSFQVMFKQYKGE